MTDYRFRTTWRGRQVLQIRKECWTWPGNFVWRWFDADVHEAHAFLYGRK